MFITQMNIRLYISSCISSAIMCPDLPDPSNGYIMYAMENMPPTEVDMTPPFDFMTVANYECNTGYGLFGGDTMRTCAGLGPTGEWNGTAPTCHRT